MPEAEFTANCTELTCSFDGSGSSDLDGTIVSHTWDFGDTNAGSGPTPSHTYAADGNYLVTLTVTDDDGATDSTSRSVTVAGPSAGISLSVAPQRVRGLNNVRLTWSGATSGQVGIYRNNALVATVANNSGGSNTHVDQTGTRGRGTFTYRVCEAGSTTVCSEDATATFN